MKKVFTLNFESRSQLACVRNTEPVKSKSWTTCSITLSSTDSMQTCRWGMIKGISFKCCTMMQTLNMGQVLRHTDPELGIGQHRELPVEAKLWNPDLPVLMQFGRLEGIAKLNKTASSCPVLPRLFSFAPVVDFTFTPVLLQFCNREHPF